MWMSFTLMFFFSVFPIVATDVAKRGYHNLYFNNDY
jgi:hypothetical protein